MNLLDVLQKVTDVDNLGLHLNVPKHELDKIRQNFYWKDEQMTAILQWWLNNDLAEWGRVISALRTMKEPVLANAVAVLCKCESLHEPPKEELQRGDRNIRKIKSLDENLRKVKQRFQQLDKEWGKGEREWREFLVELKKVEEVWEDLIKSQQTERAFLTLGISLLDINDLEPLHQTDVLEQKVQQVIAQNKELRDFYGRATEHRHGLESTEAELEECKEALLRHKLELQNHTEMEEIGVGDQVKDCKEQLGKSHERLQTCKSKMSECKYELTKPQRQLQKCKDKLTECEESVEKCRDELDNSHSQITRCIEELRKRSEDLLDKAKITVTAGGVLGAGVGTGTGVAASTIVALAELPVRPIAVGAGIGLGMVGGFLRSRMHKSEREEKRKKLQECESDLNACSKVFKRCKEVLLESKEELKKLKNILSELGQFLRTGT